MKLKQATLLAFIGSVLLTLNSIMWLMEVLLSTGVNYTKALGIIPPVVPNIMSSIGFLSLSIFLFSLYKNQK